jgi:hypothetical protein
MREKRRPDDGNLHRFPMQHPSEIELSPAKESQRLWLWLWVAMLGCWGCK